MYLKGYMNLNETKLLLRQSRVHLLDKDLLNDTYELFDKIKTMPHLKLKPRKRRKNIHVYISID